jgi:hypothetical protein
MDSCRRAPRLARNFLGGAAREEKLAADSAEFARAVGLISARTETVWGVQPVCNCNKML